MLVNNAGWSDRNQSLLGVREAEFDRVFAVNVKSIFHVSRAVVPVMRRQAGGRIITSAPLEAFARAPALLGITDRRRP
jgi:3-oxoacyl-[acyl-carrier protein] reductase